MCFLFAVVGLHSSHPSCCWRSRCAVLTSTRVYKKARRGTKWRPSWREKRQHERISKGLLVLTSPTVTPPVRAALGLRGESSLGSRSRKKKKFPPLTLSARAFPSLSASRATDKWDSSSSSSGGGGGSSMEPFTVSGAQLSLTNLYPVIPFNATFPDEEGVLMGDRLGSRSSSNHTEVPSPVRSAGGLVIAISITALYSVICVVGLLGNVLVMYGVVR